MQTEQINIQTVGIIYKSSTLFAIFIITTKYKHIHVK